MVHITEIDDPRIEHYRELRFTPASHNLENIFIAEGKKVTQKLLKSNLEIISIFATEDYYEKYADLITEKNIPEDMQFTAYKQLMNKIVGFRLHAGIMAMGRQPEPDPLFRLGPHIAILNEVINSENVGAIVRNAVAFGFNCMICDRATSSPWLRRAVRVSMGSVFDLNLHYTDNLPAAIDQLQIIGYKVLCAEITDKSLDYRSIEASPQTAIIFGSEGQGVAPEILDAADSIIQIPVSDKVDSINVAASSAIMFNHFGNRR